MCRPLIAFGLLELVNMLDWVLFILSICEWGSFEWIEKSALSGFCQISGSIHSVTRSNMSSVLIFPSPRFLPPPTAQHRLTWGPFTLSLTLRRTGNQNREKQR